MSAIIPDLTRTPDGLVAANVVTGSLGELGAAIGPIVAGLIIFFGSPGWVFAACSLLMFAATVVVSRLYLHASFRRVHTLETADVIGHVFDGVRVLGQHRNVRVMVALLSMKALVAGVLDVVGVAFAGERLGAGGGTAGVLAGAVGFGAVVGSAAAAGLSRGGRTVRFLVISAFLVGLPLVILDSVERMPFGLMLVMLCGAGAGLLRVTSTVAIQRFGPLSALTRIFGIAEGLQMFALAVGSYGVAELTSRTSLSTALLVAGIGLTSAVLLGTWQFSRTRPLDVAVARDVLQRLVADPHLRRLPAPAIERVARSVEHVAVAAGEVVIRQGDHGDRYFVVLDGSFDVIVDGAHVGTLDASGSFGSVALLNDVARTATVVATSSADLLAVPRADFLEAVTGRPEPASMTATS
jgi:MFS family permease